MEYPDEPLILAVNDDPDQLGLMRVVLNEAGYNVVTATNGLDGYEIARREHPHLVISDVAMPVADGIAVTLITAEKAL